MWRLNTQTFVAGHMSDHWMIDFWYLWLWMVIGNSMGWPQVIPDSEPWYYAFKPVNGIGQRSHQGCHTVSLLEFPKPWPMGINVVFNFNAGSVTASIWLGDNNFFLMPMHTLMLIIQLWELQLLLQVGLESWYARAHAYCQTKHVRCVLWSMESFPGLGLLSSALWPGRVWHPLQWISFICFKKNEEEKSMDSLCVPFIFKCE